MFYLPLVSTSQTAAPLAQKFVQITGMDGGAVAGLVVGVLVVGVLVGVVIGVLASSKITNRSFHNCYKRQHNEM